MFDQKTERPGTRLRASLAREQPLLIPGAHDAMSAKLVELGGFPAVYISSLGSALSLLGMPDTGLITATEMQLAARYTADSLTIPLVADASDGYGNAINVMRTTRDFIAAGVAGIHLDDQQSPPR
jgi:2-methylisocitrate lyase-like PEP mutase family enzyme